MISKLWGGGWGTETVFGVMVTQSLEMFWKSTFFLYRFTGGPPVNVGVLT